VTLQDDWQRWCDRFDKLHNGVIRLFHDRAIWRTILAMLDANPGIARGGFGEYWLGSCYTDSMLIGIRRETGADGGSIGLQRCLAGLSAAPRIARRDWYEHQVRQRGHQDWDGWDLAAIDAAFDIFAAPGQPFIDATRVTKDIAALEAVISRVNAYTTKSIAHRDDKPDLILLPAAPPVTWAELDAALDAVGGIYKKYYRLRHPGEVLGALTPLISPGWIQMFQTAWMPIGFTPPDDLDFEPAMSLWSDA
jgi:hypothetical protein